MSCIDCGACEPECPWQATFEKPALLDIFTEDIALNNATAELQNQFKVATFQQKEHPTPEQVAANKLQWGLEPLRPLSDLIIRHQTETLRRLT